MDKRTSGNREGRHERVPSTIIGDVAGKVAIVVDDIVDTGSRIATSADLLKRSGAKQIYGAATHAVLSGDATERLLASPLEQLVVTDTIQIPDDKKAPGLVQLSVAPLLAQAIVRIHNHQSIHDLYHLK